MDFNPILRITSDGSPTLYCPAFQATYHSQHGALQESQHVFIQQGLLVSMGLIPEGPIRIFEMGFGTGLNAWLTFINSIERQREIIYHSVEKDPLPEETICKLRYWGDQYESYANAFGELHAIPWNQHAYISPLFQFYKEEVDVFEAALSKNIDLIYYDAFGPETQPEMWTTSHLNVICNLLNPGGIFVTYCAKGAVRRSLVEIGMDVERLPGPPGKREMLRAQRGVFR